MHSDGLVLLLVMLLSFGGDESKPAGNQQGPATAKVERKPNLPTEAGASRICS